MKLFPNLRSTLLAARTSKSRNRIRLTKACIVFISMSFSFDAVAAWYVSQVKIKHVQVGNADMFVMTVDADTTVSGCNSNNGWVAFSLENATEKHRMLVSLALSAYVAGIAVDIGSTTDGCVNGYAHLNFIRVGNKDS